MTKENIKTNTSLRYSQYQKRLLHTFSFEKMKKQIEMLHDQEFIINVPIGGVVDGMDLTTVTGVNRWKFAYQSFCCHAASRKDISGKSIRDDETESKRNSCNLTWF